MANKSRRRFSAEEADEMENGSEAKDKALELLMRVVDVQSRCIEALGVALGARAEVEGYEVGGEEEKKEEE